MNSVQDTVESGGLQAEQENKKKWKIPRMNSAPLCYSMYGWTVRLSFGDMTLGICLAVLFFWFSTLELDNDSSKAVLIVLGVIFCIIAFFGILLCVGLWSKKNKVLLQVYYWYAFILAVITIILFLIISIYFMAITGEIGNGFLFLLVGVVLSCYLLYVSCMVYSIYMNIIENKEEINLKKTGC